MKEALKNIEIVASKIFRGYMRLKIKGAWHKRADLVWEYYHGERPLQGYIVHHNDENKLNDNISNLSLITRAEHCKMHLTKREVIEKRRATNTGKPCPRKLHKPKRIYQYRPSKEQMKKYYSSKKRSKVQRNSVSDEEIINLWVKLRSDTQVGRKLGLSQYGVKVRRLKYLQEEIEERIAKNSVNCGKLLPDNAEDNPQPRLIGNDKQGSTTRLYRLTRKNMTCSLIWL